MELSKKDSNAISWNTKPNFINSNIINACIDQVKKGNNELMVIDKVKKGNHT